MAASTRCTRELETFSGSFLPPTAYRLHRSAPTEPYMWVAGMVLYMHSIAGPDRSNGNFLAKAESHHRLRLLATGFLSRPMADVCMRCQSMMVDCSGSSKPAERSLRRQWS